MAERQRVLLAGCGRLGRRLAKQLAQAGCHITALTRHEITGNGIHQSVVGDLTLANSMTALNHNFDVVVYSPTPDKREAEAYQQTFYHGLKNLLERDTLRANGKLIFVSSTAVYGQDDGSWIDESSRTLPIAFNGQILLESEQLALAAGFRTTVVRLAGLYGNTDNYLIRQLTNGTLSTSNLQHWTNRIHLQDATGLVTHLLMQTEPPAIVNGVDDQPALRFEVIAWLTDQLQRLSPSAELKHLQTKFENLNPSQCEEIQQSGKRISNQRSRALGYLYKYPDFRSGYAGILSSINN